MAKLEKRSPLKDKPLRNPGQSLDEQRDDLLYNKVLAPSLYALFLVILAGLEWGRYYFPQTPSPKFFTVIAVFGIGYAAIQIKRAWPV